jgi:hypothetical protein
MRTQTYDDRPGLSLLHRERIFIILRRAAKVLSYLVNHEHDTRKRSHGSIEPQLQVLRKVPNE